MKTTLTDQNWEVDTKPDILETIRQNETNIAIYKRDVTSLRNELGQVADFPIECRTSGTTTEILSVLKNQFDQSPANYPLLYEDISSLLSLFEAITEASSFRLLLTSVSTNMCRIFHTDIIDLRLLCTYLGPGTLWLPDNLIDIKALREGKGDRIDKRLIRQVPAGDVAILKGALYEDSRPVLHKSPSIEGLGQTRFLLRIDTNEFISSFA